MPHEYGMPLRNLVCRWGIWYPLRNLVRSEEFGIHTIFIRRRTRFLWGIPYSSVIPNSSRNMVRLYIATVGLTITITVIVIYLLFSVTVPGSGIHLPGTGRIWTCEVLQRGLYSDLKQCDLKQQFTNLGLAHICATHRRSRKLHLSESGNILKSTKLL